MRRKMPKPRKPLSKKKRFEVLKRDSFTCQYCGVKAPDVILHIDHIKPISKGGTDALINLITSCRECNQGKSNRKLNDKTVIEQSRKQLDILNEKNEQLKMMIEWMEGLDKIEDTESDYLSKKWFDATNGSYSLNQTGVQKIKRLLKKYGIEKTSRAMDTTIEQYFRFDGDDCVTQHSIDYAFNKLPGILRINELAPEIKEMYYIRGILRNRIYCDEQYSIELMKKAYEHNVDLDSVKRFARACSNWTEWKTDLEQFIKNAEPNDG